MPIQSDAIIRVDRAHDIAKSLYSGYWHNNEEKLRFSPKDIQRHKDEITTYLASKFEEKYPGLDFENLSISNQAGTILGDTLDTYLQVSIPQRNVSGEELEREHPLINIRLYRTSEKTNTTRYSDLKQLGDLAKRAGIRAIKDNVKDITKHDTYLKKIEIAERIFHEQLDTLKQTSLEPNAREVKKHIQDFTASVAHIAFPTASVKEKETNIKKYKNLVLRTSRPTEVSVFELDSNAKEKEVAISIDADVENINSSSADRKQLKLANFLNTRQTVYKIEDSKTGEKSKLTKLSETDHLRSAAPPASGVLSKKLDAHKGTSYSATSKALFRRGQEVLIKNHLLPELLKREIHKGKVNLDSDSPVELNLTNFSLVTPFSELVESAESPEFEIVKALKEYVAKNNGKEFSVSIPDPSAPGNNITIKVKLNVNTFSTGVNVGRIVGRRTQRPLNITAGSNTLLKAYDAVAPNGFEDRKLEKVRKELESVENQLQRISTNINRAEELYIEREIKKLAEDNKLRIEYEKNPSAETIVKLAALHKFNSTKESSMEADAYKIFELTHAQPDIITLKKDLKNTFERKVKASEKVLARLPKVYKKLEKELESTKTPSTKLEDKLTIISLAKATHGHLMDIGNFTSSASVRYSLAATAGLLLDKISGLTGKHEEKLDFCKSGKDRTAMKNNESISMALQLSKKKRTPVITKGDLYRRILEKNKNSLRGFIFNFLPRFIVLALPKTLTSIEAYNNRDSDRKNHIENTEIFYHKASNRNTASHNTGMPAIQLDDVERKTTWQNFVSKFKPTTSVISGTSTLDLNNATKIAKLYKKGFGIAGRFKKDGEPKASTYSRIRDYSQYNKANSLTSIIECDLSLKPVVTTITLSSLHTPEASAEAKALDTLREPHSNKHKEMHTERTHNPRNKPTT